MLAGAVVGAAQQLSEKLIGVAAHMMEADMNNLELRDSKVDARGVPGMEKAFPEVALHAHYFRLSMPDDPSLTSGLDAAHVYDHLVTTLPADDRKDLGIFYPIMGHMCHLPVVEVDIETGKVKFLAYVAGTTAARSLIR